MLHHLIKQCGRIAWAEFSAADAEDDSKSMATAGETQTFKESKSNRERGGKT